MKEDNRSPVWGGATLGLIVGLILGFFYGDNYWKTVLYAVIVGAALGIFANILALFGKKPKKNSAEGKRG